MLLLYFKTTHLRRVQINDICALVTENRRDRAKINGAKESEREREIARGRGRERDSKHYRIVTIVFINKWFST